MADDGMSDEERKAYEAARELIEEVKREGGTEISFDSDDFRALTRIPDEIAGLEGVKYLNLNQTQINDLTPIAGLRELEMLYLGWTLVKDLAQISELRRLKGLFAHQTKVSDISAIEVLSDLQSLSLGWTAVKDLSPISQLTELQSLSLTGTRVRDLYPVSGLKKLRSLYLSGTFVVELKPISGLNRLQDLFLDRTRIIDLSPLSGLTELKSLHISQTQVASLAPISRLTKLKRLYADQTRVSDLSSISDLTELEYLSIDQTGVNDLTAISNLTSLEWLSLKRTKISDLSAIRSLYKLESLYVDYSNVTDLRPVSELHQLGRMPYTQLSIRGTPFANTTPMLSAISVSRAYKRRTQDILTFLKTLPPWPEPLPWLQPKADTPPPEQDPALPLVWGEMGFTFLANSLDSDPVTEAALNDLRALLEDLRRKGNRHDDLYRLAGELQERCAGPVADLNMVSLHLSYQKLRRLYQTRGTRAEGFDDETVGVMGSVLEIVPGVTLADPGVEELIARQEKDRLAGATPESAKAENDVLDAIQDPEAPFAPEVKDVAAAIQQPGQDDRLTGTRRVLARNSLIAIYRFLRSDPLGAGLTGSTVIAFVIAYGPQFLAVAQTMGTDAFLWAQMTLASVKAEYQIAMGIAREGLSAGALPLGRRKRDPE